MEYYIWSQGVSCEKITFNARNDTDAVEKAKEIIAEGRDFQRKPIWVCTDCKRTWDNPHGYRIAGSVGR